MERSRVLESWRTLSTGATLAPDCLLRSSASFTPDDESNSHPLLWFDDRQQAFYQVSRLKTKGPRYALSALESERKCKRHRAQKIQTPPTGG
jgi:hypothetical protein